MAQRRMFTLRIVDTDAFLDMPQSSQLLYFHLVMRADDDGFVCNPKKIAKIISSGDDDTKVLIAKRFIIPFDSGIIVIKHWRMHNLIRSDRYTETNYIKEKSQLAIKSSGSYTEIEKINAEEIQQIDGVEKPEWQIKRQEAMKNSSLPYSFAYKIKRAFYGKLCPICRIKMEATKISNIKYGDSANPKPSIQHNIPISKGGKHELGNISIVCHSCNVSIRDKKTDELNSKEVIEVWNTIGTTG